MYIERNRNRDILKGQALIFLLLAFILGLLFFSLKGTGPIVLGSERNGNGSVEYLCLGMGCDDVY